jgi:hypothetical protein
MQSKNTSNWDKIKATTKFGVFKITLIAERERVGPRIVTFPLSQGQVLE